MEENKKNQETKFAQMDGNKIQSSKDEQKYPSAFQLLALLIFFMGVLIYMYKADNRISSIGGQKMTSISVGDIAPVQGVVLPVAWGDLGAKMIEAGVIDKDKFDALYKNRGGLQKNEQELAYGINGGKTIIDQKNSGILLNLLWALGLGNKNPILDNGPMRDPKYGGADRFASTGGWTLSKGNVMDHYSAHQFIALTKDQQVLVEKIASNIYRPCCDNPTYFPDCNHGMAMLGLLELMASQNVSESEMYKVALQVNSYWFPDNYRIIALFLKSKGVDWKSVNPKDILGVDFSSGSAYGRISSQVKVEDGQGGGSCSA